MQNHATSLQANWVALMITQAANLQAGSKRKQALIKKEVVSKKPHSTTKQETAAVKVFRSLTDRAYVTEAWSRRPNAELCDMAAKYAIMFWSLFKVM